MTTKNNLASEVRAGYEVLCPGVLQRHSRILIQAGLGRQRRLWAVDQLVRNPHWGTPISDAANYPRGLFALGTKILLLGCQAIRGRATFFLRTRLYPWRKFVLGIQGFLKRTRVF